MAITPQRLAVSNRGRRKRSDRLAQLRMMQGQATQDVLAQKEIERMKKAEATQAKQHRQNIQIGTTRNQLLKEQAEVQERAGRMGMGIQMGRMGLQAGQINKSVDIPWTSKGINLGPALGGGLMGAGAGQALGGKNKLKKTAIGAGVGALGSYLMADTAAPVMETIGGGFLGALGGLL